MPSPAGMSCISYYPSVLPTAWTGTAVSVSTTTKSHRKSLGGSWLRRVTISSSRSVYYCIAVNSATLIGRHHRVATLSYSVKTFWSCRSRDPSTKCSCTSNVLSAFSLQKEFLSFSIMAADVTTFLGMLVILMCSSQTLSWNASRAWRRIKVTSQVRNFSDGSMITQRPQYSPPISFVVCIPWWSTLLIQKAPWWLSRV